MKYILTLLLLSAPSVALGQYPYNSDYARGSLEYRRAKAEQRTQARREAEKDHWARMALRFRELGPEEVAASKLRLAMQLIKNGRLEAGDRWLNEIVDNYKHTQAGIRAAFEIGR